MSDEILKRLYQEANALFSEPELQADFNPESTSPDEIAEVLKSWNDEINGADKYICFELAYLKDRMALRRMFDPTIGIDDLADGAGAMRQKLEYLKRMNAVAKAKASRGKHAKEVAVRRIYEEVGVAAEWDVYERVERLINETRELGRTRPAGYQMQVDSLNVKIDALFAATRRAGKMGWYSSYYSDRSFDIQSLERELYTILVSRLVTEYDAQLSVLENTGESPKLTDSQRSSLLNGYIEKKVLPDFADVIKNGNYEREDRRYEKEDVDEAVRLVFAGMHFQLPKADWLSFRFKYPQEIEQLDSLNERVQALPYGLRDFVTRYLPNVSHDGRRHDEIFQDIVDSLYRFSHRVEIPESLADVVSLLRQTYKMSRYDPGVEFTSRYDKLKQRVGTPVDVNSLDIDSWEVARSDDQMKALFGEDALAGFDRYVLEELWSRLLVVPPASGEHIGDEFGRLGYKVYRFKQGEHLPYAVMNLWRGRWQWTRAPFSGKAEEFIGSLNGEELKYLEGLKVPGMMDAVRMVKEGAVIRDDSHWDYPSYNPGFREALFNMASHYMTHGSDRERYFALGLAVNLLPYATYVPDEEKDSTRDRVVTAIASSLGLEDKLPVIRKYGDMFDQKIAYGIEGFSGVEAVANHLRGIAEYMEEVESIAQGSRNPEAVMDEANSILHFGGSMEPISEWAFDYLREIGSERVQEYWNGQFGFNVRGMIGNRRYKLITDHSYRFPTFLQELREFEAFLTDVGDIAYPERFEEQVRKEQQKVIHAVMEKPSARSYMLPYLRALGDEEVARIFPFDNYPATSSIRNLVAATEGASQQTTNLFVREALRNGLDPYETNVLGKFVSSLRVHEAAFEHYQGYMSERPKTAIRTAYELSTLDGWEELFGEVETGASTFRDLHRYFVSMERKGIIPTTYLMHSLSAAESPRKIVADWKTELNGFGEGNFDPENELHRNLEYTRFRDIVDHEKVKRFLKNHITYTAYETIFSIDSDVEPFDALSKFEVECAAYEVRLLEDYVRSVKVRAQELGMDVVIAPNLSYGYLPVAPLTDDDTLGVDYIIGVKVGSTESHNNKEVLNSGLFKGYRTRIANDQPVILVVDGTKNLVARDSTDRAARYPDAYQGYLNQVVAINDALGFTDVDYSHAGKTEEDMAKLRGNKEFQRTVDVYRSTLKEGEQKVPYSFQLWNTALMPLIIRGDRTRSGKVWPFSAYSIDGPTMIYCNVGVLDSQIPSEIKEKHEGRFEHTPAYFDDSGKIIQFDFGFDKYGVRYLNRLETEVRQAYSQMGRQTGIGISPEHIPALMKYLEQNRGRAPDIDAA